MFRLLVLNKGHLGKLAIRLAEIAFSALFFVKLKVASEPVSKSHGAVLRYALIAINNKLYNYDFGRDTNTIKYAYALIFIPSIITHLYNLQALYSVTQLASVLFEVFCMIDLINTTQSEITYYILLCVKAYRIFDISLQSYQEWKKPLQRDSPVKKVMKQQEKTPLKDIRLLKRESLEVKQVSSTSDTTNDSVGSTQPNNDKQEVSQAQAQLNQKPIQKAKQPTIMLPAIRFQVKTCKGTEKIVVSDYYQFDEVMNSLNLQEERDLLHTKLNFSSQIYKIVKNQAPKDTKLQLFFLSLIAQYNSALLLLDE